jgi:hypothetical protein
MGITVREALHNWLNIVMADKVMFSSVIDKKLITAIGLENNTMDNFIRIIKDAAKETIGKEVTGGKITNILVEKKHGLWKIIVFKARPI